MVLVLSIKNDFYKIKKSIFRPNYARYDKMLRNKIIHLKKIYKFFLDHFLVKCTVLVLSIKNDIYKIETSTFQSNHARYEKILTNKIVHLKKIYKFVFDYFLVKCMVLVLSIKNGVYKIKKSTFWSNYAIYDKMLRNKIVGLKKILQFCIGYFFIG